MKNPNQFNPDYNQIAEIKYNNLFLPEGEQVCWKCGHKACSSCKDWCDCMLSDVSWRGNWDELEIEDVDENGKVWPPHACCNMKCSYL